MPSACAAMPIRPPSSVAIATLNPFRSSWSRFSRGTFRSSNSNSDVDEQVMPIFSSILPTLNPGVAVSTMNAHTPRCRSSGATFAYVTQISAWGPLVIHIFVPFST